MLKISHVFSAVGFNTYVTPIGKLNSEEIGISLPPLKPTDTKPASVVPYIPPSFKLAPTKKLRSPTGKPTSPYKVSSL